MSNGNLKHSRALSGGAASARVNRKYPMRAVLGNDEKGKEVLACGHRQHPVSDMIGVTYASKRRCKFCPARDLCECGHDQHEHVFPTDMPRFVYDTPGERRTVTEGCIHTEPVRMVGTDSRVCACPQYRNVPPPEPTLYETLEAALAAE